MSTIESICADLGITIAQCHEPTGPLRTKAGQTLRRMLLDHGDGHVIITLRTIVESSGNERALTASGIQGVSDLLRPPSRTMTIARANRESTQSPVKVTTTMTMRREAQRNYANLKNRVTLLGQPRRSRLE
jgi:hypothetical protein